ncbi:hypothetical protein [Fulvitalea axinellae]|uniref:hypothetical protein n=1 Tax=Fulvitalea axinellae TaxID=1182444 RepID=UPI0030CA499A
MLTIKNPGIGVGIKDPVGRFHIYTSAQTGDITKALVFGSGADDISSMFKVENHGAYRYSLTLGTYWGDQKGTDVPGIMTLKQGNVGIGYHDPKAQLVLGDKFGAIISGNSGGEAVFGTNLAVYQGGPNHGKFYTPYSHENGYGYAGIRPSWGGLFFYGEQANTVEGEVINPKVRMVIDPQGNVGIGSESPKYRLSVKGQANVEGAGDYYGVWFGGETRMENPSLSFGEWHNNRGTIRWDNASDRLVFSSQTNSTSGVFDNTLTVGKGMVGIGTIDTGTHRLAVEGSIGARSIKVEASGWSDFVFEKGYDLPSLSEVEAHIKAKGHLEHIPSAEDVEKDGVDLGAMDAKLLRKIEELTLYAIEQEKRLVIQGSTIDSLGQETEKVSRLETENQALRQANESIMERMDRIEALLKSIRRSESKAGALH